MYSLAGAGAIVVFDFAAANLLKSFSGNIKQFVFATFVVTYIVSILYYRFNAIDKSSSGWVMHKYAENALESLPKNSLLLSHTDLDWNPIRYLRTCEGARPDVTHISFQMMPFPWFQTRQKQLYPQINFPNLQFHGVSTTRGTAGNAELVHSVLIANDALKIKKDGKLKKNSIGGGIFVDFQAIDEAEIQDCGRWRDLTLIPWGTLYRVYGNLNCSATQSIHNESFLQLKHLQGNFPAIDDNFIRQYPAGSWEFAAASVLYDAHYQFGLNLLTFAIESKPATPSDLMIIIDRIAIAAEVLKLTQRAVNRYGTISSSVSDVNKNTALAWLKFYSFLSVARKLESHLKSTSTVSNHSLLLTC